MLNPASNIASARTHSSDLRKGNFICDSCHHVVDAPVYLLAISLHGFYSCFKVGVAEAEFHELIEKIVY